MSEYTSCLRFIYGRGAQLKSYGGPKFFLTYPRANVYMFEHIQRVFLSKKQDK